MPAERTNSAIKTRHLKSGKLKASKAGQWRIGENDLEKFLEKYSNIRKEEKFTIKHTIKG